MALRKEGQQKKGRGPGDKQLLKAVLLSLIFLPDSNVWLFLIL